MSTRSSTTFRIRLLASAAAGFYGPALPRNSSQFPLGTGSAPSRCQSHGSSSPPSASATGLSAAPRWERLRDRGHGRRPSPTQTAPRGGRSRDYLVGGGRSASHVPYPDLAGRHRGQAAIGATGVTGAALNSLFYRSRVQRRAVTCDASWLHRDTFIAADELVTTL